MRFGIGYDVHPLKKKRKLVLGGVEIPSKIGLFGHSDGDVFLHAVCDALLGAAGLGDIGQHFPDTDSKYKNISSLILLKKTYQLIKDMHYEINNIDGIIIAEAPKISGYFEKMKEKISEILEIEKEDTNIKATTSEGLGFIGRKEGISAYCVVSIIKTT